MNKIVLFLMVFVMLGCSNGQVTQGESETEGKRVVGYFTSWSAYARNVTVGEIAPSLLTHINFAFANLNSDGTIIVGDSWVDTEKPFANGSWEGETDSKGHFQQLRLLKTKYPHIKTLISVGGWTWSGNFSQVAANEQKRKQFASSAVAFIKKYGFDGIDIDWEFPVEGGNGIAHSPQDKENYTKLLAETRKALDEQGKKDGKHYLLTMAGGPNISFVQNIEGKKVAGYLDFINIMAYDYHGAWENKTGHNAPLYAEDSLSVSDTVNAYLAGGIPAEKCNLGLPFYGRGWSNVTQNQIGAAGVVPTGTGSGNGTWEAGVFDYWDIAENYIGKNNYIRYFDEKAGVPYLYDGNHFISYDDKESIQKKCEFAKEKGLGGVMFWEFAGDKKKELQKVVSSGDTLKKDTAGFGIQTIPTSTVQQAVPKTEPTQKEWDKLTVYTAGDEVIYQNTVYHAKWWTQGEVPGKDQWGPWEKAKE